MSAEKCKYLQAAYPDLDAEETCSGHRHDEPTFALATAMAKAFQGPDPSDEQIGWCMEDASAVVDDFKPAPETWEVSEPELTTEAGLEFTLTINGAEYVIQPSEWEPSHPVSRTTWDQWQREANGDEDHD